MNHHAAHVICDHPEHPAAAEAASYMLLEWIFETSEHCWCAGWMSRCEIDLYRIVQAGGGDYGMGEVSAEDASTVRALIEVGGWWKWVERESVAESGETQIAPGEVETWWREAGS